MDQAKDQGFWRHPAIQILMMWAFALLFALGLYRVGQGWGMGEAWQRFTVVILVCWAYSSHSSARAASGSAAKWHWARFVLLVFLAGAQVLEPLF